MELERLNINSMRNSSKMLFISKRNTGKTTLVKYIFEHFPHMAKVVVSRIPHNEYAEMPYTVYKYIQNACTEETISDAIDELEHMSTYITGGILILDDCLNSFDRDWQNWLTSLLESDLMVIVTFQYPLGILEECRNKFDYVLMGYEDIQSIQQRTYSHYGQIFPNFDVFKNILLQHTSNYGFLVIWQTCYTNLLIDAITYTRANINDDILR